MPFRHVFSTPRGSGLSGPKCDGYDPRDAHEPTSLDGAMALRVKVPDFWLTRFAALPLLHVEERNWHRERKLSLRLKACSWVRLGVEVACYCCCRFVFYGRERELGETEDTWRTMSSGVSECLTRKARLVSVCVVVYGDGEV
ncbi:hypothetical protein GBA52_005154 [Prunus armeniaca]|nr:hypothetical protein GBA52_005154 [Prunus armeniaca]